MCGLELPTDPNLIVGLKSADDAGVYLINDELALIQTVDFFTPIVDDPYYFGQIAAANALSDVYAMGGVPKTAMNLVAFPSKDMDLSILREILKGGIDKLREAGAVLVGGHSIEDKELKYGLSVTGFVHPKKVLVKKKIQAGDLLVLTKPIGTGIATTAIKAGLAPDTLKDEVTNSMAMLNRYAAEIMEGYPVNACTDITGFGLLGHLAEMVEGSNYSVELWAEDVPVFQGVLEMASMGLIPAGAYRNREFRAAMVDFLDVPLSYQDILFDPQTSGGLLIAINSAFAQQFLDSLKVAGISSASIIGEVFQDGSERIIVKTKREV